jgi:O-antigen/teichoic acid export membrane protein
VLAAWLAPVPFALLAATVVAIRLVGRGRTHREPLPPAQRAVVSREFWRFSAARGLTAGIEILLEWADVLIVGALASPTAAGIYAVATRCARGGEVVQQAARIAIGPTISAALARGERETVRAIYGLVTAAMIWVAWPFYFVLAIFGSSILAIFGPGFSDGTAVLAILAIVMGVATAAGAVQTILLMGGRGSWQLADKSSVLVLNLALDIVLVPAWGIRGAAVAWAVAILVDTGLVVWQVQGLMGLRPRGRHIAYAAGVSMGLAGIPLLASRLVLGSSLTVLLWTLAVVVPTYLVVGWVLRVRLGIEQLIDQRVATRPDVRRPGHR